MCNEPERSDPELVRNLVSLWTNQNTLVYGRLTNISALQTAVFAGWYSVFDKNQYFYAMLVGVIGGGLSWVTYALVDCDLNWKRVFGDRLRAVDSRLLPPRETIILDGEEVKSIAGWKVMKGLTLIFFFSNLLLIVIPALHLLGPVAKLVPCLR